MDNIFERDFCKQEFNMQQRTGQSIICQNNFINQKRYPLNNINENNKIYNIHDKEVDEILFKSGINFNLIGKEKIHQENKNILSTEINTNNIIKINSRNLKINNISNINNKNSYNNQVNKTFYDYDLRNNAKMTKSPPRLPSKNKRDKLLSRKKITLPKIDILKTIPKMEQSKEKMKEPKEMVDKETTTTKEEEKISKIIEEDKLIKEKEEEKVIREEKENKINNFIIEEKRKDEIKSRQDEEKRRQEKKEKKK